MGYDRGDSFPFDFEPNGIPSGSENRKENCHHDHIPFNVKGNVNIVFSVWLDLTCPRFEHALANAQCWGHKCIQGEGKPLCGHLCETCNGQSVMFVRSIGHVCTVLSLY